MGKMAQSIVMKQLKIFVGMVFGKIAFRELRDITFNISFISWVEKESLLRGGRKL